MPCLHLGLYPSISALIVRHLAAAEHRQPGLHPISPDCQKTHRGEWIAITLVPSLLWHCGHSLLSVILTLLPSRSTKVRSTSSFRAVQIRFSTFLAFCTCTFFRSAFCKKTWSSCTVSRGGRSSKTAEESIFVPCRARSESAGVNIGLEGVALFGTYELSLRG